MDREPSAKYAEMEVFGGIRDAGPVSKWYKFDGASDSDC